MIHSSKSSTWNAGISLADFEGIGEEDADRLLQLIDELTVVEG